MAEPVGSIAGGFREQLLALPAAQRGAALADRLRHRVADLLDERPERVSLDVAVTQLSPAWQQPFAAFMCLRPVIKEDLGFGVYPRELTGRDTLRLLAEYLAGEVAPEWEGRAVAAFDDPYEGGTFRWRLAPSPPPDAPQNPGADFVLSAPRCGSTLFRAMLAGHPDLFVPPELNLLPFASMGERGRQIEELGYTWMRLGPLQALAALDHMTPEEAGLRLDRWEHDDTPVPDVYRRLQELAGHKRLVDKSPIYTAHPAWLHRAEELFAEPRYLLLLRHPYSVMESFVRMRFHRLLGRELLVWDEHPWRQAEKVWATCYRHALDFLGTVDPERWCWVRFEELVGQPRRVLAGVCDFLRLPFDEAVLHPYAEGRMAARTDPTGRPAPTIGDPNLLSHTGIDPSLGEAWRQVRPPQSVSAFTREVAADLGYELPC